MPELHSVAPLDPEEFGKIDAYRSATHYLFAHGEDMPEVRDWVWSLPQ